MTAYPELWKPSGIELVQLEAARVAIGRSATNDADAADVIRTEGAPARELTRRGREVLRALCRPLFGRQVFAEPVSLHGFAAAFVVTGVAVQQHLLRLDDEVGIAPRSGGRRSRPADEAVRRGAVTLADLRDPSP
jgi:hypothetical protein